MTYVGKKPADIIATAVDTTTGTFSGDLTVDTNTLYVDSANNRVGVGTASPARTLSVERTGGSIIGTFKRTDSSSAWISFQDSTTTTDAYVGVGADGNALFLRSNNAERMRIDSSGNLLVGKTTPNVASVGFEAKSDGANFMTRDGGEPLKINRKTSDGNLIALAKDGTTVGSIGVVNTDRLYIGTPDGSQCAIRFDGDTQDILPSNASGTALDDAISLGDGGTRFKNLYLSGGVYLGGTGSANFMSDYEEGTFAPTLAPTSSGSFALASASDTLAYTKIGRQVTITGRLAINTVSSPSGDIKITGLPFTSADLGDDAGDYTAVINFLDASAGTQVNIVTRGFDNTTELNLKRGATTVATSDQFYVNFSYFTT